MNTPENLAEQMREKTDDQLRAALAAPNDWLPEALEAVRSELRRRGVQPTTLTATPAALKPTEDINQQILSELRRLRRGGELNYLLIALLLLAFTYDSWRDRRPPQRSRLAQQVEQIQQEERARQTQPARPSAQAAQPRPWGEVSDALDRFDDAKAISLLQGLIARQPSYYYGYTYLGNVYLAMGDLTNAEAQYLRAFELFPDEENEKTLSAIRKRIARERGLQSPSR